MLDEARLAIYQPLFVVDESCFIKVDTSSLIKYDVSMISTIKNIKVKYDIRIYFAVQFKH